MHSCSHRSTLEHAQELKVYFYDCMNGAFPSAVVQAPRDFHSHHNLAHTWHHQMLRHRIQSDGYSCGSWAIWLWLKFMTEVT